MAPSPRGTAVVGLLATGPVVVYAQGNADPVAAVAAVNVVLIVASLRTMLREDESMDPVPEDTPG